MLYESAVGATLATSIRSSPCPRPPGTDPDVAVTRTDYEPLLPEVGWSSAVEMTPLGIRGWDGATRASPPPASPLSCSGDFAISAFSGSLKLLRARAHINGRQIDVKHVHPIIG